MILVGQGRDGDYKGSDCRKMNNSNKIFKIAIYSLVISLTFALLFIITDIYIFPDACGLMLFVPILILSYLTIVVSGVLLLIILLFKLINKIRGGLHER